MILILILIIARTQKDSALEASRSTLYRQEGILDISRQFGELKLTIIYAVSLFADSCSAGAFREAQS